MKILVVNGANINMLGIREQNIYGTVTFNTLIEKITAYCKEKNVQVECFQSNHEGDLVDKIQDAYNKFDGIVINAGGYTHTSVAILDALKAVNIPTVEVHISDIENREDFRKFSFISLFAEKKIIGQGINGYFQAIDYFLGK